MAKTKYEVIEVNSVEFTVDVSMLVKNDDMFFNATEIAKQFDKRPADFWKQSQNDEYLESTITLYGGNKEDYVKTRTGSKYGGTWFHQKLALQFARWLSSDFAVRLDKFVIDKLKDADNQRKAALEAKTGYLDLSIAVDNDHDPAKHYHFSNEANLINRIVLGMDSKKYKEIHGIENIRENLDTFQITAIKELQSIDTALIKTGVDYQARKDQLTKYYKEKILLPQ